MGVRGAASALKNDLCVQLSNAEKRMPRTKRNARFFQRFRKEVVKAKVEAICSKEEIVEKASAKMEGWISRSFYHQLAAGAAGAVICVLAVVIARGGKLMQEIGAVFGGVAGGAIAFLGPLGRRESDLRIMLEKAKESLLNEKYGEF